MNIQSKFQTALRDFTEWCCIELSKQEDPAYTIRHDYENLHKARYMLLNPHGDFEASVHIDTATNTTVCFVGPAIHEGMSEEQFAIDSMGHRYCARSLSRETGVKVTNDNRFQKIRSAAYGTKCIYRYPTLFGTTGCRITLLSGERYTELRRPIEKPIELNPSRA